jgi:nanoRNase/pAp phosphatase (c-di-AMP/oligoRNAs hydrolase)
LSAEVDEQFRELVTARWSELQEYINDTLKKRERPRGSARDLLILTHNNPDPDSIAAAYGLQVLLEHIGLSSRIAYGGIIARPENKAMVELLKIEMSKINNLTLDAYPLKALVDTQPGTGNNSFPENQLPDIVIDHHPRRHSTNEVPFSVVYTDIGSSSTIITYYLRVTSVPISRKLSTALYYGIKTDTQNLGRGSKHIDFLAAKFLYPSILTKTLAKIEHPRRSLSYFRELLRSLTAPLIYGDVIFADAGKLSTPDILAEVVDIMISIENIRWAISVAEIGEEVDFSIRTNSRGRKAGQLAQYVAKGIGTGGGHDMTAGGQIPVNGKSSDELKEIIKARFLTKLGRANQEAENLL